MKSIKDYMLISVHREILSYPTVRLLSASELSESLSELETVRSPKPMAFSNSKVNLCRRLGEQQQHCQEEARISDKHASLIFLSTHVVQKNTLHDLQLIKSLLRPHHPQKHSEQSASCHNQLI